VKVVSDLHPRQKGSALVKACRSPLGQAPSILVALLLSAVSTSGPASAQDFVFSAPDLVIESGATFRTELFLDSSQAAIPVNGCSVTACWDASLIGFVSADPGSDLVEFAGVLGLSFFAVTNLADAVNVSWLLDTESVVTLPPVSGFAMVDLELFALGPPGLSSSIDFCAPINLPNNVVVDPENLTYVPIFESGEVFLNDQNVNYRIVVPSRVSGGELLQAKVLLDAGEVVTGFRFGLEFDQSLCAVIAIEVGAELALTRGGAGPEQFIVDLDPAFGDGLTCVCEIDTVAPFEFLPPGTSELCDFTIEVTAPSSTTCEFVDLRFTDLLGTPNVPLEVDFINGTDFAGHIADSLAIAPAPFDPPSGGILLEMGSGGGELGTEVLIPVHLDSDVEVQAFSFGVTHSSAEFELRSFEPGAALLAHDCSSGPDFFDFHIASDGQAGAVIAILSLDLGSVPVPLEVGRGIEIVRCRFALPDMAGEESSEIEFTGEYGSPPVAIEVTAESLPFLPDTSPGRVYVARPFVRAECNGDGTVNIADAITLLDSLFPSSGEPGELFCSDACDSNDDGTINIGDAISILLSLFGPLTLPGPTTCGPDLVDDDFGCLMSSCP